MTAAEAQDRPLGWWLKHVEGLREVAFDRSLEREGIARRHWQLLNVIAGGAGSVAEAQDAYLRLNVDTADLPATSDQLLARGWLYYRAGRLEVTPVGAATRERLASALAAHRDLLTAGIDSEHYRITVNTLRRIAGNLSGAVDGLSPSPPRQSSSGGASAPSRSSRSAHSSRVSSE
ncbi:MAG TPA: hypothetical protein VFE65_01645 [Pseudonocardia sp.]|nr:hypothetical protein [Pseudonocardia sp.]